jgi:2-phosphoglycerate kinase
MPQKRLTIIINGATGVGKTTTSSHLSRMLNCSCISTDYVRQRLRDRLSRQQCPVIFRSSYEIGVSLGNDTSQNVLRNYAAQATVIISEIGRQYLGSADRFAILEGVHLNTSVLSILKNEEYVVLYLRTPSIREHRRRLRERNLLNRAMNNKHDAYFEKIRAIGIFLDHRWSVEAHDNKRVFLIDTWQEVDAILGRLIGDRVLLFPVRAHDRWHDGAGAVADFVVSSCSYPERMHRQ